MCCDRVLRVTTWFPGMLGRLGRERVFFFWPCVMIEILCSDRVFFFLPCVAIKILCRDKIWGWAMVFWVMTRAFLCRDRVFPMGRTSMSRHSVLCRDSMARRLVVTRPWA